MAGSSNIEWCDASWNPVVGCSIHSPGCKHCYAMRQAHRLASNPATPHYAGTTEMTKAGPVFTGKIAQAPDHVLLAPTRWRKPRRIFVNSMGDLFHESIPDEWIDHAFAVMALCPQHTFQVLTKRVERMWRYLSDLNNTCERDDRIASLVRRVSDDDEICLKIRWPLRNLWLGISAERQQEADERIPLLLQTPAAIRFVSAEPLLGPIDLGNLREGTFDAITGCGNRERLTVWEDTPRLDWVIVGGESGPGARPMEAAWARSIRDQCDAAGAAFFFKQWGRYVPDGQTIASGRKIITKQDEAEYASLPKALAGRMLDGVEHSEFPISEGSEHKPTTLYPDPQNANQERP
jgi:protein gp37